ncbi:hypothetical protein ASZ78_011657 [Callipepla squamata]|uniref:Uncharacterized protein n=1 Tax=Callipepla squamata TaxID=9009 RepID=A0A226NGD9_CALSU|nr:hypothetical protein ASZ78_011657 [Callipepla squamata]
MDTFGSKGETANASIGQYMGRPWPPSPAALASDPPAQLLEPSLLHQVVSEFWGLSPLHIAASLPGEEGVNTAKYLLSSALHLDGRAEDGNEVDKMPEAGADVLAPVTLQERKRKAVGTVVDFAYYKYYQVSCNPDAILSRLVDMSHNFTPIPYQVSGS